MLNSYELKTYLSELDFEHTKDNVRIDGFSHPNLEFPVYTKTSAKKRLIPAEDAPIVVHVQYEKVIRQLLLENNKILAGNDFFFFNSNMSGFEKKLHKGKTKTEFGIHLNIANKQALIELINTISDSEIASVDNEIKDSPSHSSIDEKVLQAIKTRRGQPAFRKALLAVFDGTCCITGCKVEAVLEAAHIVPHGEETNFSVTNGLLLRADIHTLFDLGLLRINGYGVVQIDVSLKSSDYQKYDGVKLMGGKLPLELKNSLTKRSVTFNPPPIQC